MAEVINPITFTVVGFSKENDKYRFLVVESEENFWIEVDEVVYKKYEQRVNSEWEALK